MKTKYVKVQTSERMPDKNGVYLCRVEGYSNYENYRFLDGEFKTSFHIEAYLIEVPNREQELIDRLEEALNLLDDFPYEQSLQERRANLNMNAQNLIWEIKNNAPKLLDDE